MHITSQAINVMSSPGSGKTTVLQHVLAAAQAAGIRTGVIEGDIETSLDADRLGGYGAQISLLNTGNGFGGECHLDAPMVAAALSRLDLSALDLVLIETWVTWCARGIRSGGSTQTNGVRGDRGGKTSP